jgi:D-alanine-D-alanine ligase-like ATP-grasp enzyme
VRTVYTNSSRELICESIRRDAETAARVVGSAFLGVDVITLDPSVPLRESGGVINEVNTTPALHHHYDASREPYPAAAVLALQALLERPSSLVRP